MKTSRSVILRRIRLKFCDVMPLLGIKWLADLGKKVR
jgi:hypothetical protein